MEWSIRKIAKVAGMPMAIATVVAEIVFVAFVIFSAMDSYFNHYTYSTLDKDVNGTIVINDRQIDNNIIVIHMVDGKLTKTKTVSGNGIISYPNPEKFDVASNNKRLHAVLARVYDTWDDQHAKYKIKIINDTTTLATIDVNGLPIRVSWSYNNSSIYFPFLADNKKYVAKYNLQVKLIDTLFEGDNPSLSHDGNKIAYLKNNRIFISDTLGHNIKEIIGDHLIVQPSKRTIIAWSPNDKYLAFCGETILGRLFPTWNLYIAPISRKNRLTTICYDVNAFFYWVK